MGFHPSNPATTEDQAFLVDPTDTKVEHSGLEYSMMLVQKFKQLYEASCKLHKIGYYDKWPKEYYDDVVLTRQNLYKKIFTNNVMDNKKFSERPMAVFYVSDIPWTKLSGKKMPAGTVRHVTPVVGYNVVLHADYTEDHIRLYDVDAIKEKYHKDNCSVVWREVNWDAVKRYDGRLYYV